MDQAFVDRLCQGKPAEAIQQMIVWLVQKKGFIHTKINDGEALCMLKLRPASQRNNCGHHYFTDLADELVRMMDELNALLAVSGPDHMQIGSYWFRDPKHEGSKALIKFCEAREMLEKVPWVGCEELVVGIMSDQPDTASLIDTIRHQARPKYLVGNKGIHDARYCLGAEFIEIPRYDCWKHTPVIREQCYQLAADNAIFIWCAGMSKPWAWDLWIDHPGSTHIDAGSLFDPVFGDLSRAWMRRQDSPLWECMRDKFTPYVKGFIK